VTVGWALSRSAALAQLGGPDPSPAHRALYVWIRFAIPAAILSVGLWWLLTDVLGTVQGI
jgi:hypothetical protein